MRVLASFEAEKPYGMYGGARSDPLHSGAHTDA
jgi:hypothetical protein